MPSISISGVSIPTGILNQVELATRAIEQSSLQPYCSALLGYSTPTVIATNNVLVNVVQTIIRTQVVAPLAQVTVTNKVVQTLLTVVPAATLIPTVRVTVSLTQIVSVTIGLNLPLLPRREIIPSPNVIPVGLLTFDPAVVSSACSLEANPVTGTVTVTVNQTASVTGTQVTTVTNTSPTTAVATVVQTSIAVSTVSSGTFTGPAVTERLTVTVIVTSTISVSTSTTSATPIASPPAYNLAVSGDPNAGAKFALSDPNGHMTDNFLSTSSREIFRLTSENKLYSVLKNAYYGGVAPGLLNGKLYYDTRPAYGNTTFQGIPTTDGTGRVQITFGTYKFCAATGLADRDVTGYHIYYYQTLAIGALCTPVSLYLTPVGT